MRALIVRRAAFAAVVYSVGFTNVSAAPPPAAGAATPELGRCHANSCSWSLNKGRATVKEDATSKLIRVSLLGGTSKNTDGDYKRAHIRWNAHEHEVFVFCSKRVPTVITKTELPPGAAEAAAASGYKFPPYQVDVLDFVNGIPGNLESSANLFQATCYPGESWEAPAFARRHGLPAFNNYPDVRLSSPEGIFQAQVHH